MNGQNGKHTPGPWGASNFGPGKGAWEITAEETGQSIGVIGAMRTPEEVEEANARLIAAAPDLLEALAQARELVKVARFHFPKSIKNPDTFQLENTNATINAAIRKAKGE
jgi:hypothetical protein